jgi:hypothetical protein
MAEVELAPTAEVPRSKAKEPPVFYSACGRCGHDVLRATTMQGADVLLETDKTRQRTYVVEFGKGEKAPIAYESRAYPVHRCQAVAKT